VERRKASGLRKARAAPASILRWQHPRVWRGWLVRAFRRSASLFVCSGGNAFVLFDKTRAPGASRERICMPSAPRKRGRGTTLRSKVVEGAWASPRLRRHSNDGVRRFIDPVC
jgi:hypothetical protein